MILRVDLQPSVSAEPRACDDEAHDNALNGNENARDNAGDSA